MYQFKIDENPFPINGRELQQLEGSQVDHSNWGMDKIKRFRLRGGMDFQIQKDYSENPSRPVITFMFSKTAAQNII